MVVRRSEENPMTAMTTKLIGRPMYGRARNGRLVMKLTRVFPGAARVATELDRAFDWDETKEGMRYWMDVYDRLMAMAGEPATAEILESSSRGEVRENREGVP
jgi:hypothetical protein